MPNLFEQLEYIFRPQSSQLKGQVKVMLRSDEVIGFAQAMANDRREPVRAFRRGIKVATVHPEQTN